MIPTRKYAALARDGVSCMVCHHMADQNLDDPSTYTGKFLARALPDEVYGPYPSGDSDVKVGDNVIRAPMINSVGIVPVFGAQVGEAKLCASCHTIVLPVYDANRHEQVKTDFEQTTYFEWLNSSFAHAATNRARTAICPTISRARSWSSKSPTSRTARSQWYQRLAHLHRCRLTN